MSEFYSVHALHTSEPVIIIAIKNKMPIAVKYGVALSVEKYMVEKE